MAAIAERVRSMVNDPSSTSSIGARLRARRWGMLLHEFPQLGDMRVLDLGGTTQTWTSSPLRPASVVIVNLEPQPPAGEAWMSSVAGDVCDLPASVRSSQFDLVFSNSVIEHVGGHARRLEMASAVHHLAAHHWVQTPYRYFPVEPHWLFPGFQFLPAALQVRIAPRWGLAWHHPGGDPGVASVLEVELLSRTQMRHYFPRSEIRAERVLGVTKSLIAVA